MTKSAEQSFVCKARFRVLVDRLIALGPGKVDLLEAIDRAGSISKAGRELRLSYRRAWDMVDTMNRCFKEPLVARTTGGRGGGGARLTPLGKKMARLYRTMEANAYRATQNEWKAIRRFLKSDG